MQTQRPGSGFVDSGFGSGRGGPLLFFRNRLVPSSGFKPGEAMEDSTLPAAARAP